MNWKKFWPAFLLVFVAYVATDLLIHGVILGGLYMSPGVEKVWRPSEEMHGLFWLRILMTLVFSFFFTFIFAKGYEKKGVLEGLRFGVVIALFYFLVTSFDQFIIYPIQLKFAWIWTAAGLVQSLIMGVLAALIYRPKATG